ncbi:MAG TPA: hypothetical protein VFL55_18000 [Acetobacteraceae bacterium]|nr:hypothetical protein [Acetobacteraceae bacterium]
MKRGLGLLIALLLGSCGGGGTPREQCDRLAMQDPAVQDIYSRTNGGYTFGASQPAEDLQTAKRQAVLRCMRSKGLAPPGGVQPVVPQW